MCKISITTDGKTIKTITPFDPAFVAQAKKLGGKWNPTSKAWTFDARDEAQVREICRAAFGTDGTDDSNITLVDVRVKLPSTYSEEVRMFGRSLARRPSRDCNVRLGEGVIVVQGSFPGSGGSVKNPRLQGSEDLVLEVRDVPVSLVEESEGVAIVRRDEINRETLIAERDRLAARIAEIDAILNQ